jgi:uncharacterized protein
MSQPLAALLSVALSAACFATSGASAADRPVSVTTSSGVLQGSLLLPTEGKAQTVALIIAGSGPTDRDGNQAEARNNGLRMLAQALASGGIASVRYDKRGVGGSAAALTAETNLVFRDLVDDSKAWIDYLIAAHEFKRVVVIGHSEGATIGLLAARESSVHGYISIAGPASRASDGLRAQLKGKLPPELADLSEQIISELERGRKVQEVPTPLLALFRPSAQPYLIDWFTILPTEEIRQLTIPVLIVQGDLDVQIPVSAAHRLQEANPHAELAVIERMNHVLKLVENDSKAQLSSYRDPSLPIAPSLPDRVIQFIRSRVDGATTP